MITTQPLQEKCPECGNKEFYVYAEKGQVICKKCSMVLDESLLDLGQEWGFEEDSDNKTSRAGAPFDPRIANNLRTNIGNASDIEKLNGDNKYLFKRLKQKNSWGVSLEASFNNALSNLRIISSFLKLTERVEKEAAAIYRHCAEKGLTRARSSESIVAAALYIACKIYGIPKTMKEFEKATGLNKKLIGKTYKFIVRELDMKLGPVNPIDFLDRFRSSLEMTAKTQTKATEIIEKALEKQLTSGCSPVTIAAVSLYVAGILEKEKRTQKRVAEVSGISEVSLRNRTRDFVTRLKIKNKAFENLVAID